MNNFGLTSRIREIARQLLETQQVEIIFGWEKGEEPWESTPVFISNPEDVDRLVFDDFCIHNLSNYLLDYRDRTHKIGILVKGCDSRGVVRLVEDKQFTRERLYIIGIPCSGMKDPLTYTRANSGFTREKVVSGSAAFDEGTFNKSIPDKDPPDRAAKCQQCVYPNPVIYDELLGEPQPPHLSGERFAEVQAIEKMPPAEKQAFFADLFSRCIRCYACRNVCVACNCRTCIFEETRPRWVGRETSLSDNMMYHFIRAFHVAGRCVECGECERVCPVGIPLMLLNRKLIKDVDRFFGPYEAGLSLEEGAKPPLSHYQKNDPDNFR